MPKKKHRLKLVWRNGKPCVFSRRINSEISRSNKNYHRMHLARHSANYCVLPGTDAKAIRAFEERLKHNQAFFPAFLMLSITNRCNLQCQGCWVEQTREPQQLSLQQIQTMINTAEKYDSRFFGILGGEPLLHSDLFTIFKNNPKAYFQLFTNGTILDEATCFPLGKAGQRYAFD